MPDIDGAKTIPMLLVGAWLLPLGSFGVLLFFSPWLDRRGRAAGWLAVGAVAGAFLLCTIALGFWLSQPPADGFGWSQHSVSFADPEAAGHSIPADSRHSQPPAPRHSHALRVSEQPSGTSDAGTFHEANRRPAPMVGRLFTWAKFGQYEISISYYIDTLTVLMCTMVSLVALCIHIYSVGYMAEELHEVVDPLVLDAQGKPLRRPGRFGRFFQYLSLFTFSMLGLVLAGHLVMIFIFWELVGLCSYFLIGFYRERPSAQQAAMKAFVVNRVGDMGFLVGLMALGGLVGTWSLGDLPDPAGEPTGGLFSQLQTLLAGQPGPSSGGLPSSDGGFSRTLWILAGLGIFCGCVGKSAQFPLHVWLPDAMEGPTPVSALIHAATMVAAGVYLVGRFYPAFPPEVLWVIAGVGCITLVIGATIALVVTDMKRVLAYSTISQLGYMMLGLGVGGWAAGLFHLLTHAFFKALLFLCSGSVIHAVGTNEMPQMGGLRRKMPWTAWTMLVGCLAIAGAGVPGLVGLSGFYSKEAILAQAYLFWNTAPAVGGWLFGSALVGAGLTAFYMFRLWYMTFAGPPNDEHIYHHAHESPPVMVAPLVVLAGLAVAAGWSVPGTARSLQQLLDQDRPTLLAAESSSSSKLVDQAPVDRISPEESGRAVSAGSAFWPVPIPEEHLSHDPAVAGPVGWMAFAAALVGFLLATVMYGLRKLEPARFVQAVPAVYTFLKNKWYFDQLYEMVFVRPALWLAERTVDADRHLLDRAADGMAVGLIRLAHLEDWLDRRWVDGLVNRSAEAAYRLGLELRRVQTGQLRQYVLWAVLGAVAIFVLLSLGS